MHSNSSYPWRSSWIVSVNKHYLNHCCGGFGHYKVRVASPIPPDTSANEGEVKQGILDIEMKPNSLYDLTSDNIVTKPNEVYRVSVLAAWSGWTK